VGGLFSTLLVQSLAQQNSSPHAADRCVMMTFSHALNAVQSFWSQNPKDKTENNA
jgi:hypothetical protein